MTNKGAVTDYSPEAVEAILSAFNDHVLQAIQDEDRVDDIILNENLRDPDSPWSEVATRGASPTPVAMMVYDEHGVPVFETNGMDYSKVKAKARQGAKICCLATLSPRYAGYRCGPYSSSKPYGCSLRSFCQ